MSDEQVREMLELSESGMKTADVAKKFGISVANFYYYRNSRSKGSHKDKVKHHEVPLKEIHGYRCTNCGKTFKSILPKLDAYCPMPSCSKASDLDEIPPEDVI